MLLRKINSVLSLITGLLLLDHVIFFSVWMIMRGSIAKSAPVLPRVLVVLTVVHAILSVVILIRNRKSKDAEKSDCKDYPKLNASTYIQRISGVLMLVLLGLHIAGSINHFQPQMLHAIMHPIFFAIALVHTGFSTSKALVTLGVGNATVVKAVDVIVKLICAGTFIASVIGFYLCLFVGVA